MGSIPFTLFSVLILLIADLLKRGLIRIGTKNPRKEVMPMEISTLSMIIQMLKTGIRIGTNIVAGALMAKI